MSPTPVPAKAKLCSPSSDEVPRARPFLKQTEEGTLVTESAANESNAKHMPTALSLFNYY